MAKVYRFCVGLATALALCKYCLAEWNVTDQLANRTVSHCHLHGNRDNCTDTDPWIGHFSKCPEELTNYCVHGDCRYIEDQKATSCRCEIGYSGSRCEYLNLDWLIGEKREIVIALIVAGLVLLIVLIIFTCLCSQRCRLRWQRRRRRRREEPTNGTEKVTMLDTSPTLTPLSADTTELQHTDTV